MGGMPRAGLADGSPLIGGPCSELKSSCDDRATVSSTASTNRVGHGSAQRPCNQRLAPNSGDGDVLRKSWRLKVRLAFGHVRAPK
jgi:hypothetical protein